MAFYLQIPKIKGSVKESKHEGWIQVDSIDFCNDRSLYIRPGAGAHREHTVPSISDLIMIKDLDASSPHLYQSSLLGSTLGEVVIQACNVSKNSQVYLEYKLYDAMISHYDMCGVSPDSHDEFKETIHLNFTKFQMKYIPQDASGRQGSPIISGYDIGAATKL